MSRRTNAVQDAFRNRRLCELAKARRSDPAGQRLVCGYPPIAATLRLIDGTRDAGAALDAASNGIVATIAVTATSVDSARARRCC